MKPKRIELIIKNLELDTFNDILMKIFFRERSPNYPVCIDLDYIGHFNEYYETTFYEEDFETFRFSLASVDSSVDDWRVLAKIHQSKISSQIGVIVLGEEEQVEEWEKVNSITEKLITKIQQFGGEIVFVDPTEFMLLNLIPEKDKSKKQEKPNKIDSKKRSLSAEEEKLIVDFNKLKESTKNEYRRRYILIIRCKELMNQNYRDGIVEKPPRISKKDIIDCIYDDTGEVLSDNTFLRTKNYGKLGLLD